MSEFPRIEALAAKIEILARRKQHLETRVRSRISQGDAVSFDVAEASALGAAVQVLEWYSVDRGTAQGDSPLQLLRSFAECRSRQQLEELQNDAERMLNALGG